MSRNLSAANESAVTAQRVRPRAFVQIDYDSPTGSLYLHDGIGEIATAAWDGTTQVFYGIGDLGTIEAVEEAEDLTPFALAFTLSGIDATLVSQTLTDDSVLRKVFLSYGYLNENGELVDDPHRRWKGEINEQQFVVGTNGEPSFIRIIAESFLIAFDKKNGRLFNDADQQDEFVSDVGFQYLPQMETVRLQWGGATKSYGNSMSGGASSRRARVFGTQYTGSWDGR